ncbi:uncharacterized protein BXZ73DRAFT_78041 [Epithele typhae]|uniref:uncharacterized protein n=1 Tax=Epithele typhae TaxID=378194 RepID=UPI00200899B7|nr:uncharacterized protein BXZ73DRAFT_78041 [Epithele typhae]KAH9929936.1 hypothetical protein BXZ73DRAFT_78041 [Epithele typhae]
MPWLVFSIGEVRRAFYEGRLRFKSVPTRTLCACYEMENGRQDPAYTPSIWNIQRFSTNAEAAAAYGFDFCLEANDQGDVPVLVWEDVEKKSWIESITPRTAAASSSTAIPSADRPSTPQAESSSAITGRDALPAGKDITLEDVEDDRAPPSDEQSLRSSERHSEKTPKNRRNAKKRNHRGAPKSRSIEATRDASSPEPPDVDQRQTRAKASTSSKGDSLSTSGEGSDDPAKRSHGSEPYVPPEPFFPPFDHPPGFYPCARVPRPTAKNPLDWRCSKCRDANGDCVFFPGSSAKCDLGYLSPTKKGFAMAYSAYKAAVQWANPHIYPNPIPATEAWALLGHSSNVPTWFKEWWREHHTHAEETLTAKRLRAVENPDTHTLRRNDMESIPDLGEELYRTKHYPYDPHAPPPSTSGGKPGDESIDASQPPTKKRRRAPKRAAPHQPTAESLAPQNQAVPPPRLDFRNVPPTPIAPEDPVRELRTLVRSADADFVSREEYNVLLNRFEDQVVRTRSLEVQVAEMRGQLEGILFAHGGGFPGSGSAFSTRSPFFQPARPTGYSSGNSSALQLARSVGSSRHSSISVAPSPSTSALPLPPSRTASRSTSVTSSLGPQGKEGASRSSTGGM